MQASFEKLMATTGRVLLGLDFILPGLTKVFDFDGNADYRLTMYHRIS